MRHAITNGHQRPSEPPGGVVDVLVASKGGLLPVGLENIPWKTRVLVDDRKGWAAAANALLDQSAAAGHDAIFIDDDVTILPETFAGFHRYYPLADVFGFRLRGNTGGDQCGWGLQKPNPYPDRACYAAHVTASLMYLRAEVLQAGVRFPLWPGIHYEDLVFTYDCWYQNFAVAYLPLPALHDIEPAPDGAMVGATKRHELHLELRRDVNHRFLDKWAKDHDLRGAADDGRIPFGVWGIDP
jgi:hypothetical protein